MKTNKLIAAILFLVACAPLSSVAHADLVYDFYNHPLDQNGHSLSGTITTTDTAHADGSLTAGEVISWSWSTSGSNPISGSSSDLNSSTLINGWVSISPTEITLAQPNIMSQEQYGLVLSGSAGRLIWVRDEDGFGGFTELFEAQGSWQSYSPGMSNTDPWLVATVSTVPEPSSGLALLALVGYCLRRRR